MARPQQGSGPSQALTVGHAISGGCAAWLELTWCPGAAPLPGKTVSTVTVLLAAGELSLPL